MQTNSACNLIPQILMNVLRFPVHKHVITLLEDLNALVQKDLILVQTEWTVKVCQYCIVSKQFVKTTNHFVDVNECVEAALADTDICHSSMTCINLVGGYDCECPGGTLLRNGACVDPGMVCITFIFNSAQVKSVLLFCGLWLICLQMQSIVSSTLKF